MLLIGCACVLELASRELRESECGISFHEPVILVENGTRFTFSSGEIPGIHRIQGNIVALLNVAGIKSECALSFLKGFLHIALKEVGQRNIGMPCTVIWILLQ